MKKVHFYLSIFCATMFTLACNDPKSVSNENQKTTTTAKADTTKKPEQFIGVYCFMKAENKDTTMVKLNFLADEDIRGEMTYSPYQKDGAKGELKGKLNANREMELKYDYVIEGSRQTETKIMKISGDTLAIKQGELIDPKKDGNLIFKDVTKATYKTFLLKTKCN